MSGSIQVESPRLGREPLSQGWRLVLLAAIAAGLGFAVLRTVLPRLEAPPAVPLRPLVELDPGAVRELDVTRGATRGRLVRTAAGWVRETGASGGVPVDGETVDDFLRALARMPRLLDFQDPDLPAFGLAPPRGEIGLGNGREVRIVLGDRNPPLTALYVQVLPGSEIILVGSILLWEFDKLATLVARPTGGTARGADPSPDR